MYKRTRDTKLSSSSMYIFVHDFTFVHDLIYCSHLLLLKHEGGHVRGYIRETRDQGGKNLAFILMITLQFIVYILVQFYCKNRRLHNSIVHTGRWHNGELPPRDIGTDLCSMY